MDVMSLIDDWVESFKQIFSSPSNYFEAEQRRDGFGYPLKFALVSLVIAAVINSVRGVVFGAASLYEIGPLASLGGGLIGGILPFIGIFFNLVGLFIGAAVIHLLIYLLGGKQGYSRTLAGLEYATLLAPLTAIASFIPILGGFINLALGIYGIFIQAKALENFQRISFGRALVAILIPVLLLIALAFLTILASFMAIAGLAEPSTMPAAAP